MTQSVGVPRFSDPRLQVVKDHCVLKQLGRAFELGPNVTPLNALREISRGFLRRVKEGTTETDNGMVLHLRITFMTAIQSPRLV